MPPIRYAQGELPDAEQLREFYRHVPWTRDDRPEQLSRALEQSQWVATAWDGEELVGLARVLTDGVFTACLQELLVHAEYQHQGVGKELLDRYDLSFGEFREQVAVTDIEWVRQKLGKRGFRAEPAALSRKRTLGTGAGFDSKE